MNPWRAPAHGSSRGKSSSSRSSSNPAFKPPPPPSPAAAAVAGMFAGENILVAVNAAKGVSPHALEWALSNVAQAGDHISLIALLQGGKNGRRIWGFPNFTGDCATRVSKGGNAREMEEEVTDSCSSMMQQLHNLCYYKKVKVNVRVVPGATNGAIALEAQRVKATWVILDSQLRKEEAKSCMQQLQCNLVIVKRNGNDAKVQRLNLRAGSENGAHPYIEKKATNTTISANAMIAELEKDVLQRDLIPLPHDVRGTGTHTLTISERPKSCGSPGGRTPFTATEKGTSSTSSSEHFISPLTSAEVGKMCSGRNGDGDESLAIETDSASDYDAHDANSCDETSSDDASHGGGLIPRRRPVLCRTAHASPDQQRTKICNVRHCRPSQQWGLDCNLTSASQPESYTRMRATNIGSNSANVTPQTVRGHQRCTSTPASPLHFSKRFTGPPRLSSRMRAGGIIIHHHGSLAAGRKENTSSDEKQHYWQVQNKMGKSERVLGTQNFLDNYSTWDHDSEMIRSGIAFSDLERTSSVRKAVFLSKNVPPGPPPLCSICQHKAPVFGKPPRRFTYGELELATGGFSQANFLAEGGFGCVHRGVLADGQAVAVKQHKLASTQGDSEFCSEVEVLSCAQHRNVVMLIGYCIEDKRRLLVYEFICNASLDSHLYGKDKGFLEWAARQKIAIGAARGLRYLHEECRVGCIVHRDMRPNNILLTHDFEPMVGDFGLARWQPDGDLGVQTRVIGTFGYLAPEYAQSGQITEKADVYSFGVVLVELATGRKAVDLTRPKGQQCLTEWARPLLDEHAIQDLVDPLLRGNYSEYEVYCMLHAASLCLRKDPNLRPRMSQVLRILEGDVVINTSGSSTTCSYNNSSKVRPNGARRRISALRHGMN